MKSYRLILTNGMFDLLTKPGMTMQEAGLRAHRWLAKHEGQLVRATITLGDSPSCVCTDDGTDRQDIIEALKEWLDGIEAAKRRQRERVAAFREETTRPDMPVSNVSRETEPPASDGDEHKESADAESDVSREASGDDPAKEEEAPGEPGASQEPLP